MNLNIFSDLRKPGLVPGESLSLSTNINSVLEKNQIYKISFAFYHFLCENIQNIQDGIQESLHILAFSRTLTFVFWS